MSLEETKRLLRTFRILPNKLLGQNFMVEPVLYSKLCEYACVSKQDVVLDAGAGFGFLAKFLSDKCCAVLAVEKDPRVAAVLREQIKNYRNVNVIEGDLLKVDLPHFDKVIAIPPYYLSSRLIMWLLGRKIECAVLVLQKEFAEKLVAPIGTEDYSWLAVVASREVQIELFDVVSRSLFYPQPEVDSTIIRLTRSNNAAFTVGDEKFFYYFVRRLFTQRNKKVCNALAPILTDNFMISREQAVKLASAVQLSEKRVRELSPKEFGELANAIWKQANLF